MNLKQDKKPSICVYCGSRYGTSPLFSDAANELGRWIGNHGYRLVYGGGNSGLMGTVANATLETGGEVYGVIPESLVKIELGHSGITELVVVKTMHQRKQAMADASDAFLALPGGIGTFEEFFEAWTWRQLKYHDHPIGLLNINGYYDPLLRFIHNAVSNGFMSKKQLQFLTITDNVAEMMDKLDQQIKEPSLPDSFENI